MRVALGQMEVIPGKPSINGSTMLQMIAQAKEQGAQMIVFSEMCLSGYLVGDLWEQQSFLRDCEAWGQKIIAAAQDIWVLFGNVAVDWHTVGEDGRVRKYNAFFVAGQGRLWGGDNFPYPFRIKTLQPNYREFDDSRYFYSLRKLAVEKGEPIAHFLRPVHIPWQDTTLSLGCLLCEDGWSDDYAVKPMDIMAEQGVDLFINLSSSPFTLGKREKRHRVFGTQAKTHGVPLLYVNHVGIQNNGKTVYTFDGSSTVYHGKGQVLHRGPSFAPGLDLLSLGLAANSPGPITARTKDQDAGPTLVQALIYGIKKFIQSIGINKVVIGLSGGIDSAVSAALYRQALEADRVLLVNMPSRFNSDTTKGLARQLAGNLGCLYTMVPIQEAVDFTVQQITQARLEHLGGGTAQQLQMAPLVLENIQARDRSARVLAGLAAAFGGGFPCNANKSELTVGYGTLYGDLAGFFACLADLWKHQVYQVAEQINHLAGEELIPRGIIDLVPSAELSAAQAVDQGKGDPLVYPYHDYLFWAFMERWDRATPEDILGWYLDGVLEKEINCQPGLVASLFPSPREFVADLERWWQQYTGMGVAKRIQAPPVLAVSRRAYGFDHREAQNGVYYTTAYQQMKASLGLA